MARGATRTAPSTGTLYSTTVARALLFRHRGLVRVRFCSADLQYSYEYSYSYEYCRQGTVRYRRWKSIEQSGRLIPGTVPYSVPGTWVYDCCRLIKSTYGTILVQVILSPYCLLLMLLRACTDVPYTVLLYCTRRGMWTVILNVFSTVSVMCRIFELLVLEQIYNTSPLSIFVSYLHFCVIISHYFRTTFIF